MPSTVISFMQIAQICWTTYTEAIFRSITIPKCDSVLNIKPVLACTFSHVPDLMFVQTVEDLYLHFCVFIKVLQYHSRSNFLS